MRWTRYLYEHAFSLILMLFLLFTMEVFLMIAEVQMFLHFYLAIVMIGGYLLCLYIDYKKQQRYFKLMFLQLQQLDQKYLLPEVLPNTSNQEQALIKKSLYAMESSMIEQVNLYKNINSEYKEFIELWIHEVKTPIATSKMIIENNPTVATHSIEEELQKVENYVEQALFYARSSEVEKDFIIKEIHLLTLINRVIKRNKLDFIQRNIKLSLENLDQVVNSDVKWLEFILQQIIINAIKYMNKPDAMIEISAQKQANLVRLMIKDNGCGIPKQDLKRVFDKGFTGSKQRENKKATGLGLYLVKKLCLRIGLEVLIDSIENEYTTLTIIFPYGNMTKM